MSVRLTYFDAEGFGEPIRLSLKFAGVDFEDKRIVREDWAVLKKTVPNGTVPILEIGENVYTETVAIVRYLGIKYGLLP